MQEANICPYLLGLTLARENAGFLT